MNWVVATVVLVRFVKAEDGWLPALIGAAGGLLGGILNRNSQKSQNALDWARQKQVLRKSAGWQFGDLMEAADESGIHRLAAIGGAQAGSYTPGIAPRFDDIGEASRYAAEAAERRRQEKREEAANRAAIEREKAETELLRAQSHTIYNATRASTIGGTTGIKENVADPTAPRGKDLGPLHPEAYNQRSGPYKGKYIFTIAGKQHIFDPKHNTPKEVLEAVAGEIASELSALHETGRAAFNTPARPKPRGKRTAPGLRTRTKNRGQQW